MRPGSITRRQLLAALSAPSSQDLHWKSIDEAASLVRSRKVSPVDLTRSCLERVDRLNPKLNAFITVNGESALADARAAEKEIGAGGWKGPLHGIPIALKDLFDTAGLRTTAASAQYADRIPAEDAEVVRRLKTAGAVVLGKLNMDEFAYNFTSETSYYGPSRNPWDAQRTPGGSSGGSAIAVAAGMCFAALGSDTGGSIRLPASFCGISGFKPSYGRVPVKGVVPLSWSLDHVGPMCRSAMDAATVLRLISDTPANAGAVRIDAKRLRVGLPKSNFWQARESDVSSAIGDALKTLLELSRGVEEVDIPVLPASDVVPVLPQTYLHIIQVEAYAYHEGMLNRNPQKYHPQTRASIENGAKVSSSVYARALQEMNRLRREIAQVFEKVDLVVTPTAPGVAFNLGSTADLVFLRNTAPWNLYGLPTISIPCGFAASGLPVGLQLTGGPGKDEVVLAAAGAFQMVTEWHMRRPPAL